MDPQLGELLESHKAYFKREDDGRVTCLANGHSFPARHDVIAAFINGKRFPKLKKRYDAEQNLGQFEPFIVQSKNFPTMLYCTVTGQLMDKSLDVVRTHMGGKKYVYNKGRIDSGDRELKPEPNIEDIVGIARRAQHRGGDEEEAADGEAGVAEDLDMEEEEEGDGPGPSKRARLAQLDEDDGDMLLEEGVVEEEEAEEEGISGRSDSEADAALALEESEEDFEFVADDDEEQEEKEADEHEEEEGEEEEDEDMEEALPAPAVPVSNGLKGTKPSKPAANGGGVAKAAMKRKAVPKAKGQQAMLKEQKPLSKAQGKQQALKEQGVSGAKGGKASSQKQQGKQQPRKQGARK